MKEFDLKSIWDGAEQDAKQWYQHLRPELIAKAKKQNDSVLHKIQRLVITELIVSVIATIGLLIYIREMEVWLLVATALFFSVLVYISFHQYRLFKQKADQVPTLNIVESTETYLKLVFDYKKRLNRIAALLIPVSIIVGLFLGFNLYEDDLSIFWQWKTWATLLPVLIGLSIASVLATKWYYNFFIGSKEKELQLVLDSLREENAEDLD